MCTFLKMDRSTYIKKFMISIVGFVLLACVNKVAGANSYVFVSPNVVRPGRDFTIHGTLVDVPYVPVTITAELFADQIVASAVVTVVGENVVKLDLPVPVTVNIGNKKTMRLEIRGTGGLTFSESKQVDFEDKSISMYIQTDKGIYKPGQTVKFRVFGATPDMKVVNDKLKVELFDPKDNKINQWDVSNAELTSLNGVYIQEQVMSSEPVLGTWKLRAKLLSYGDDFEEKTFKVAEYVLPKFEVELDLPSFGRTDQTNFVGKVKAKYTFGQPVKGMADLLIKPTNERFEWRKDRRVSVSNKIELKFPINGEAEFTVPMTRLKEVEQFLSGTNLKFEVNVTEDLTKFKQSDEQELTFYDNHIKLKFPKSLPDTFKPGMVYDSVVIVSQQDDTPPDNINGQLKVTITEYRRAGPKPRPIIEPPEIFPVRDDRWNRKRPRNERLFQAVRPPRRSIMPPWRPPTRDITKVLPPIYLNIPADGFVTFPVEVDKPITKLVIKAEYNGISTTKTLKKRHSPSNTYLQTRLLSKNPSVGQSARIEVKSTSAPGSVNYQVFSRGTIVESGKINMGGKKMVWNLPLTAAMAPRAKIVSFYVRNDGEIVADALVINIDGSVYDNKVDIQFSTYEAAPADQIQVDVRADAGSKVHILGVDKSVLLLASGNDVTNQQVLQDLREFDTKSKGNSFPFVCDWFCLRWPVSVGGEDTKDVFDDAGVLVITDALVYEHLEPIQHPTFRPMFMARMNRPLAMPGMAMPGRAMERQMLDAPVMMAAVPKMAVFDNIDASLQNLAPVQRSRTVFPETWLWVTRMVESNGSVSLYETVPDTITSWIASAFAVHPTSGLGVANPTSPLTVSLPFFVTANLPYSVIRGEKVIIQINIFNYNRFPVVAKVTFSKSDSFKNIIFTSAGATNASQDIVRTLTIQPDEGRPLYFPIIPDVIGLADIKVTAQSTTMSDAIHKRLLVEAEGSPREYNKPILVDLETVGTISETVDVVYPVGTVHGSEIVRATVIGDLMGPSISGLDSLLKLPYGCGEQNMLNFAPNIFIVKYLEATNSTNADVMHKAKDFMETGYQRELTYAHPDGSFSAFGESDKSGSTWLTAFVLKSFVQAKPYIFVDDKVIHKAIDWLITQQETMGEFKGTFSEPGRVIHKAMQGGSTSGKTSLTAYVLIALLEARSVEGVATKISSAQNSAMVYLEKQISQTNDVYDLAIVSYALTLAGSLQADTVWNKLDAKAKTGAGTKYWEKSSQVIDNTKPWQKRNGVAINIEITSYALLTLAYKQNRVEGVKVLKWITEQRNPNGGFSSTQDTVLALQSLAEMASLIYSSHRDITVTITGKGASEIFKINDINAQILQSRNLPPNVGTVTVTATGIGQALVQIEVLYNIETDGQKQSFELTVELIRESLDDYEVRACTRWLEQESSSMAVLEIESLSGFVANIDSVFTEPAHKKVELNHRKVIFYFDEITSGRTCATITMQRIGMVAGAQPVAVRIYDYYEPSKQVTEFYVPILLKNSEVCEICGQGCDACNVKPR